MSKGFIPSAAKPGVITANDLRLGHCVWMRDGGWTADPREAELFEDEAIAELALLEANRQANLVVGPYLVEARRGPDGRPRLLYTSPSPRDTRQRRMPSSP